MSQEAKLDLLDTLPPDVKARLLECARVKTYGTGESLFSQDEQAEAFYILLDGRVKILRVTTEGYESILCVRCKGEHFCPVPLLDEGTQLGTAFAMTDVTLLWVNRADFLAICHDSPELLSIVQGDCLTEVRHLLHRFEIVAFRSVRERVAHMLLAMSKQQDDEQEEHVLLLTQQELGALVGASRESVSRALSDFEKKGIVQLERGRVTVLNTEKLAKITGI